MFSLSVLEMKTKVIPNIAQGESIIITSHGKD